MSSAIIFDLDGTLLDTEPDFTLLLNRLLEQHQRPPVSSTAMRQVISSGAKAMICKGFGMTDNAPQLPALLEEFLSLYEQHIPHTQACLYEDVDLLIASLHDSGIPWGIMTNKMRRFSEPLLSRFESFSSCVALVCPDDVSAAKPDPAGILHACAQLDIPAADAVYVGDHPRDIEAAHNAGMPGIAVSWGYLQEDSNLSLWGAEFIAHSPRQLATYLSNIQD